MSADEPVFEKTYLISVEAPQHLGMDDLGKLVDVVADVAYEWAEQHKGRDWDLFIGGSPKDDATHSAEAAHAREMDRSAELEGLLAKVWKYVAWAEVSDQLTDRERALITRAVDRASRQEGHE